MWQWMFGNAIADYILCCVQPVQWSRSPGKSGSHFHPSSDLFQPNEKKDILTSTACWLAMAGLLAGLTVVMGPLQMLKLYGVPYWVRDGWYLLFLHLQPQSAKKSDFLWICGLGCALLWWCSAAYNVSLLNFPPDFCYVAGLCHLPAPPRPQRQASLVSWKGKNQSCNLLNCELDCLICRTLCKTNAMIISVCKKTNAISR
jgi:hypothetical protein